MKNINLYIIVLISFLLSFSSFAKEKELDSLLIEAKLKVYTDPLEVIKIGDSLYNNEEFDLKEQINGVLLIADALISIRNYSQALEYLNIGKEILNGQKEEELEVKLFSRFGYLYFQLDFYDEALAYLKRAEKINEEKEESKEYFANLGYFSTVRGLIYREIINCEMGLRYFRKALKYFSQSEETINRINLSVVHYNMGNCFLSMEDYQAAEESFKSASKTASLFGQERNSLKLFAEKGIINLSIAQGNHQEAIQELKALYKDAEKINDKSLLRSITLDLSSSYLEEKDWKSFQYYADKNRAFNDEIINFKKEATVIALKSFDRSQETLLIQNKEKIQLKIILSLLIFLILFVFLGVVIIKNRREIRKMQARLFQN